MAGCSRCGRSCAALLLSLVLTPVAGAAADADSPNSPAAPSLEQGWSNPPRAARLRAYWWWLNGNVTRESITRDLEAMKAQGWGGALLCDAGGAAQDGNDQVRHGPTFFTPEWRELYRHTLAEADRLGLELSLNIQSGWNLGGPMVTADDAAKRLVWSETRVSGPGKIEQKLPQPAARDDYYRDALTVAYRVKPADQQRTLFGGLTACSELPGHGVKLLADDNPATFWGSTSGKLRVGPSREHPAWVQFEFRAPARINKLVLQPRPGYGPRECALQVSDDGQAYRTLKSFTAAEKAPTTIEFDTVAGRLFRLFITSAFDQGSPKAPRNAQVAELQLSGPDGTWPDTQPVRRPLLNWEEKAGHKPLHFSAPDSTPLLVEDADAPDEEDARAADVVDLTAHVAADGTLRWDAPPGVWMVLRFGTTIGPHSYVSTSSDEWKGYAIDVLDAGALARYWNAVVEPLIADAGPRAGRVLKYLHTDSWEVEPINWTPSLPAEFQKRRGYDLRPFLPVLAGRIIDSRSVSNRFLHDFRKTIGDLTIDNHYRPFRDAAHRHGLQIHPESGGPHAVPIDAQRCLGFNDVPMSEFWAWSWRHRIGDQNRFFVKQPAAAAHVYGRRLVAAEGFTTIGPHWQETIWDNLKPSFDKACCEGLNLLVWHAFVCSPAEEGLPGIQYFAGTHFNPNSTWWSRSGPFMAYINRCQFLLQQGLFVADACYYYGDHVPNFTQLKSSDPAGVLPGYDYDVLTEEALLERMKVQDGRLVLPDGMSYRVLVLRDNAAISLPVLRKLKEFAAVGATILGPRPTSATGLTGYPQSDAEVRTIAAELWDQGRVVAGKNTRDVLQAAGVPPDFEFTGGDRETTIDYIHRRAGDAEIYFVANRVPRAERIACRFRVAGRAPELWDAVSGQRRPAAAYQIDAGRTTVPLEFTPCGSLFVVFRTPTDTTVAHGRNAPAVKPCGAIAGPWTVAFDPAWGGPATARFDKLVSWTDRDEPGIKFYSGTATYRTTFDLPAAGALQLKPGQSLLLDLGQVRELAEVRLNGRPLGIVWAPPFAVDITAAVQPTENRLEIDVVNFWPNRIIGDQSLPPDERRTKTNIRKLTAETELMPSGLLGPVQLMTTN